MSSEPKTNRRKRTSSQGPSDAPDGDHRKRPRNRTTQSCLNCHASKRMCDRKRPACGRCVQLGLTGLCVYEIDDPAQRSDVQDDSSQLRQRVAELEGVIREMKNKPHPRWIQSGSNSEIEKWHSRSQARVVGGGTDASDSSSSSASLSPRLGEPLSDGGNSAQISSMPAPPYALPSSRLTDFNPNTSHVHTPYHSTSSPASALSSTIATPTDEFAAPSPIIAEDHHGFAGDFDFSSMFMSYPDLVAYNEGFSQADHPRLRLHPVSIPQHSKACPTGHQNVSPQEDRHCGCLNELSSYNAILELSLRLRKAADILSRSATHRMGARCLLNQQVAELDTFAATALGNISSLPGSLLSPQSPRPGPIPNNFGPVMTSPAIASGPRRPSLPLPALPGQSLHSLRPSDSAQTMPMSPSTFGDGFMSWRAPGTIL